MRKIFYSLVVLSFFAFGCSSSDSNEDSGEVGQNLESSNSNNDAELSDVDSDESEDNSASAQDLAPGEYVKISTYYGDMYITLFDATPLHKENFLKLAKEGYYNGTTFHRIIDDFMIQGGDPNSKNENTEDDGQGGPGYTIPAEFVDTLKHVRGAVAAARTGGPSNPEMRSSGSQFYIVENHNGTPSLDGQYTVFGQVVKGLDVPDKICLQNKDKKDRPLYDIKMKVEVVVIPEEE